jgi:hypothetical protein
VKEEEEDEKEEEEEGEEEILTTCLRKQTSILWTKVLCLHLIPNQKKF